MVAEAIRMRSFVYGFVYIHNYRGQKKKSASSKAVPQLILRGITANAHLFPSSSTRFMNYFRRQDSAWTPSLFLWKTLHNTHVPNCCIWMIEKQFGFQKVHKVEKKAIKQDLRQSKHHFQSWSTWKMNIWSRWGKCCVSRIKQVR